MSKKKEKSKIKTVLFRSITRIWALKKPCYLENRVVREPRKRRSACIWTKMKIISPLCIRHKKKTFYQSMVFWNMRCWLTRACRRMGWTWLENLSSGRPEGRGAALTLVVRYYYLACTYIRSPILRSCCRQARLPYTPPINRWLAQSKNWLSSNLSINFEAQGQNGQMSCQRDVIT